MILENVQLVQPTDLSQFAWAGLRRFLNPVFVADQICRLHKVPARHRKNAEKQAEQIRYCLQQAREYADAAQVVTLATKPNLYYYCIMSLALAEILMKQDGRSSLDAARGEHAHHGLQLRISSLDHQQSRLADQAGALRAIPLRRDGVGFGTFELWHRSAREMPIVGNLIRDYALVGQEKTLRILFGAVDERLEPLPEDGISLLDCLTSLPGTRSFISTHNLSSRTVRAKITGSSDPDAASDDVRFELVVHPDHGPINEFFENLIFDPNAVDRVNLNAMGNGGIVTWSRNVLKKYLPHAIPWTRTEIFFWPGSAPLNEFGYYYVALYIAGNYARYFPDRWLKDVEQSTPIALAVEELLRLVRFRMPLLTLSELSRSLHIPAD